MFVLYKYISRASTQTSSLSQPIDLTSTLIYNEKNNAHIG